MASGEANEGTPCQISTGSTAHVGIGEILSQFSTIPSGLVETQGKPFSIFSLLPNVEKRAETLSIIPQLSSVIPSWETQKGNPPAITVFQDGIGGPLRCESADKFVAVRLYEPTGSRHLPYR